MGRQPEEKSCGSPVRRAFVIVNNEDYRFVDLIWLRMFLYTQIHGIQGRMPFFSRFHRFQKYPFQRLS